MLISCHLLANFIPSFLLLWLVGFLKSAAYWRRSKDRNWSRGDAFKRQAFKSYLWWHLCKLCPSWMRYFAKENWLLLITLVHCIAGSSAMLFAIHGLWRAIGWAFYQDNPGPCCAIKACKCECKMDLLALLLTFWQSSGLWRVWDSYTTDYKWGFE